MKIYNYIASSLYWLCFGGLLVGYALEQVPFWFLIWCACLAIGKSIIVILEIIDTNEK